MYFTEFTEINVRTKSVENFFKIIGFHVAFYFTFLFKWNPLHIVPSAL